MRDLVVGYRENLARPGIEHFESQLLFDGDPALLSKQPIQVNRMSNTDQAVLRQDNDPHAACLEKSNQVPHNGVKRLDISRERGILRPQPLEIVIQVRQVNKA